MKALRHNTDGQGIKKDRVLYFKLYSVTFKCKFNILI